MSEKTPSRQVQERLSGLVHQLDLLSSALYREIFNAPMPEDLKFWKDLRSLCRPGPSLRKWIEEGRVVVPEAERVPFESVCTCPRQLGEPCSVCREPKIICADCGSLQDSMCQRCTSCGALFSVVLKLQLQTEVAAQAGDPEPYPGDMEVQPDGTVHFEESPEHAEWSLRQEKP